MDQKNTGPELIKMFYNYNSVSTARLIQALKQLNDEEMNAPGCSGNGSIRETLAHFLGTQWGWFSWFDKSLSVAESMKLRVTADEIGSAEKIYRKWQAIDSQTIRCINSLTDRDLMENWSASLASGFTMSLPLWQLLMHVANHGTHTRAQIIAAVRRMGYDPGSYEFFRFALSFGS